MFKWFQMFLVGSALNITLNWMVKHSPKTPTKVRKEKMWQAELWLRYHTIGMTLGVGLVGLE